MEIPRIGSSQELEIRMAEGYANSSSYQADENVGTRISRDGLDSLTDTTPTCLEKVGSHLKKRLPILTWLPMYKKSKLIADLIAGTTVGLTVVPQSMAYASIAGLTPEYGLYSSYIGCFLYVILGSCRQVTIGPTAVMGLLTFETCGNDFPACAILTGFYSGVFELCMGFLQLGWVVSFISEPVVLGFTAGAATTIISSQLKNFLGLSGPKGNGFLGYWEAILMNSSSISIPDCVMGISSFIALLLLRELKDIKTPNTPSGKAIKKILWLVSVSRNVTVVLTTALLAYFWTESPFKLTGTVQGGFPSIGPPNFNLPTNSTSSDYHSFLQTWSLIGAGPLIVALISVLQNVAISKAFGSGQVVDATQEMFALGLANLFGSFFSAIPISGSFSRSAVNEASGVQSPLGGLFTGILVLLSLGFLTPSFYFIPKASLAAVIISAVMFMIEVQALSTMWLINRMDFVSYLITFFCSIFLGMEYGIMIGVGISLTVLLMKSLKPGLNPELRTDSVSGVQYVYAKPVSGLTFPSVDHFRTSIMKLASYYRDVNVIVLSFENWTSFDYTVITALSSIAKSFQKENRILIFTECDQNLLDAFEMAGITEFLYSSPHELSEILGKSCIKENEPPVVICGVDTQLLRANNSEDYGSVSANTLSSTNNVKGQT